MNDILFELLKAVISVSIVLVMRYAVPYLKYKLAETIDENVFKEVLKAVKSVQQDPKFNLGTEKKEEVMIRITAWANTHGIKITQKQIAELIETAVFVMKNEE